MSYPSKGSQQAVATYSRWLQETQLPKLLFHAEPGVIVSAPIVAWSRKHLKNLQVVNIGPGIHYIQEDNPHRIGQELATWYSGLH